MREYKIYKNDLGFGIYKKKTEGKFIQIWFLDWKDKWCLNKDWARTFYHRDDALSALAVMKMRDAKGEAD